MVKPEVRDFFFINSLKCPFRTLQTAWGEVNQTNYDPQRGDIVVFNRINGHPHGHIQMYNGNQWVSDFRQNNFSPYGIQPSYTIFRW